VKKAFAPPAIHFKGSGWAKKERRAATAPGAKGTGQGAPAVGESSAGVKGGESGSAGGDSTSATPSEAKPSAPAKPAGAGTSPSSD
jgi:hypothetical protein